MEQNISHMWVNGGTVLTGEMLGKRIKSLIEQDSKELNSRYISDSINEDYNTKDYVNVTLSEETKPDMKVNPKLPKSLELKYSDIEVGNINSLHRKQTYNLRTTLMIIFTTTGVIIGALLSMAIIINLVMH